MIRKENECDLHFNEKKRKFCKEPSCWERLCPYCAAERHSTHVVVDFASILTEVKSLKDKSAISKNAVLTEFKSQLLELEQAQRELSEKFTKLKVEEKKAHAQLEIGLKMEAEGMTLEKEKIAAKIKRGIEEIGAARSGLTKSLNNLTTIAEQISLKGEGYDVKEFFETLQKDPCGTDPARFRQILSEIQADVRSFQDVTFSLAASDLPSSPPTTKTSFSKRSQSPDKIFAKNPSPVPQSKSLTSLLAHRKNHTYSVLPKSVPLGGDISPDAQFERVRRALERVNFQVGEKNATAAMLDAMIATKSEQLCALQKKHDYLVSTTEKLQEQVEKQNKALAESAKIAPKTEVVRYYPMFSPTIKRILSFFPG